MGAGSPVSRITHYRGRSDTGTVDATPTWIAAEDTAFSVTVGTAFRIRIGVENTGTAGDSVAVPDSTRGIQRCGLSNLPYSNLTNVINGADASSSADATDVTVQRLTSGTGSFATGTAGYDESEGIACTVLNGNFTEVEFGAVLTGGASTNGVGGGETWTFQVGGLTNASLNVPTFTTPDTNGSDFSHGNQLGGSANVTANSASISMTTEADIRANYLCVVAVAVDNNGTTDADHSEVSSLTIGGVSATKAVEFTNGQGSAQAGATVSIWWLQHSSQINSGSTITANFTNSTSRDAQAIQAREFVVASGKTVSVEATNSLATDSALNPASLDATTSNIECLRIRAVAGEERGLATAQANGVRVTNNTWSLWWTSGALLRNADGGSNSASMVSAVEATISTGTGAASSPLLNTVGINTDWASAYVAFKATSTTTNLLGQICT